MPLIGRLFEIIPPQYPANVEYGNIVSGLPVQTASCSAIYCSHVLEHLTLDGFRTAIRNTYSYLDQNGVFRLVMPDLQRMACEYLESKNPDAAIEFIDRTGMGRRSAIQGFKARCRETLYRGHQWLWDYRSTASELASAGFRQIRRAKFGDSNETRFEEVEERSRWDGALGVECIR
jgi:predicted SAM-dependent methyltransferase